MELQEHYRRSVINALGGYQLLEQQLKSYVAMYCNAVRCLARDKLYCGYTESDFQNAPLGVLRKAFSKTNPNKKLSDEIGALISHRNHIAHQAMNALYGQTVAVSDLEAIIEENLEAIREIQRVKEALFKEMEQLLAAF